jgi:hypothetical protein
MRYLILALFVLVAVNARADAPVEYDDECTDVIGACDKALAEQDTLIVAQQDVIKKQEEQAAILNSRIANQQKQLDSVVRKPALLTGVGVLTTVLAGPVGGIVSIIVFGVLL